MRAAFIEIDIDVIAEYAKRYLDGADDFNTLDEYAEQVGLDLQMPEAATWVKREIQQQKQSRRTQTQ